MAGITLWPQEKQLEKKSNQPTLLVDRLSFKSAWIDLLLCHNNISPFKADVANVLANCRPTHPADICSHVPNLSLMILLKMSSITPEGNIWVFSCEGPTVFGSWRLTSDLACPAAVLCWTGSEQFVYPSFFTENNHLLLLETKLGVNISWKTL